MELLGVVIVVDDVDILGIVIDDVDIHGVVVDVVSVTEFGCWKISDLWLLIVYPDMRDRILRIQIRRIGSGVFRHAG